MIFSRCAPNNIAFNKSIEEERQFCKKEYKQLFCFVNDLPYRFSYLKINSEPRIFFSFSTTSAPSRSASKISLNNDADKQAVLHINVK